MTAPRETLGVRVRRRLARYGMAVADLRERLFGKTPGVERPERIVFVCRGNICRSVFAEHAFRHRCPGLPAQSAGVYVNIPSQSPPPAVAVAREFDVDLEGHVSRSIHAIDDTPGTLYLAFEPWQARALVEQRPDSANRTHLLAAWARPRRSSIPDPFGGDALRFRACFDEIDRALEHLVSAWGKA